VDAVCSSALTYKDAQEQERVAGGEKKKEKNYQPFSARPERLVA
jgi:hypothetical protein